MKINSDLYISDTNYKLKDIVTNINQSKGDLLWTNKSSGSFAEQDVSVSTLPNYGVVEVWFYRNTNYDSLSCVRVVNYPNAYTSGSFSWWEGGNMYNNNRQFRINPAGNSIHFFQGYLNGNPDNTRGIPMYIVGYPLTFV